MNKYMTATEARKKFYKVINVAKHPGMSVTITHEGLPEVVVMSFEEFEGWQETMEIMSDPALDRDLRARLKEMKAGKLETIDFDTLKKQLKL